MNRITKFLMFVFISVLLFGCNLFHSKQNDLQKLGLKGHVHSITTNCFRVIEKFGDIKRGDTIHPFDRDVHGIDPSNYTGCFIVFNKVGYKTSESTLGGKTYQYFYDSENQLIEWKLFQKDGTLDCRSLFTYDKKSKKIQEDEFYFDDSSKQSVQNYRTVSQLNDDGNVMEEISYKQDNKGNTKRKCYYGPNQKVIKEEWTQWSDTPTISLYKYDNQGNRIEESCDNMYSFYKYDENNHLIEDNLIDSSGRYGKGTSSTKYQYTLDSYGNIIKKVICVYGDTPDYLVEYTINYY